MRAAGPRQLELGTAPDAVFSPDRIHRYRLGRSWDPFGQVLNVVMLNPSTADAVKNDPTITRCDAFARRWGFGSLVVTNLFAYRATDPADLRPLSVDVAIGPENDQHLVEAAAGAARIVVAWGEGGELHGRAAAVLQLLAERLPAIELHCFKRNVSGQPAHPLYQPNSAVLIPFEVARG